tara:strand:+ start:779 stop:883 length:105 start_codon:yes stop_codon:yes gene_type:complete
MSEVELAMTALKPLPWWVIATIAICFAYLLITEE